MPSSSGSVQSVNNISILLVSRMHKNRNIVIIALIAVVNALGYGIIIPILYSYSHKFGLSDFENGLLFSLFAICSFVSTPIIGRLSDRYGRRPLLIVSIAGTGISFLMMAFAPNAAILFLARALDGFTAGNLPVASAVISDTTKPHERARGFGIIGASFSFGFIFGPAISAVTVGIWDALPFVIAAVISFIAVAATWLFLPETNKHIGTIHKGKLFDLTRMWHSVKDPAVGASFLITFTFAIALFMFIYGFQPYMVKELHLSPIQISALFTIFGVVGLISQAMIGKIIKGFGLKRTFSGAFIAITLVFTAMFFTHSFAPFVVLNILLGFFNTTINPMTQTILSHETEPHMQGAMLGLNASYMNLGQIAGPILGGLFATVGLTMPFLVAAVFTFACFLLSRHVMTHNTLTS